MSIEAAQSRLRLELAAEDTYNVFPRFCVLNMSGNILTKFLTILVLFSRASATADLKAAGGGAQFP